MAFINIRILNNLVLTSLIIVMISGLNACGNSSLSKSFFMPHPTVLKSAFFVDQHIQDIEPPAADSIPRTHYVSIKSIYPNYSDITQGEDTQAIFSKLRGISSLTLAFHQELFEVIQNTTYIDSVHLFFIADSTYFTSNLLDKMTAIQLDPKACQDLNQEQCLQKINQVKSNSLSALSFGQFTNKILNAGFSKIGQLNATQAYGLLKRTFPEDKITDNLFNNILKTQTNLTSEQKISFINLAIEKSAPQSATTLALAWFNNDSNKSAEDLKAISLLIPTSEFRDQLLLNAIDSFSVLSESEVKIISSEALSPLPIIQAAMTKMPSITSKELIDLTSLLNNSTDKDLVINSALSKFKSVTTSEALEVIRLSSTNKTQIAQTLIGSIANFKAADLVSIAQNSSYAQDRQTIIVANIDRFTTLTANEARQIADQAGTSTTQVVISLLPKISALTGRDLATLVEAINTGTGRDQTLQIGLKLIQSSDVSADIALLNLAYNTKLETASYLFTKTNPLTAMDLATIAKNSLNTTTRDQLLLKGINSLTSATVEGVVAMLSLATLEKANVTLLGLWKMNDLTSIQFGTVLKSVGDGSIRDLIIKNGLYLIKHFDGDGAALIVERSFDNKLETADKLMTLIPNANGTDLFKILSVCGSGNTRDLILTSAIKLLTKLTTLEAKNLYTKAYNNKESVALLLMSKVDNIDGITIGEMALLSNKSSTRDLIITEGLKRLAKVDVAGLIAMIKASDTLAERLALEISSRIENFAIKDAIAISKVLVNNILKDKFLVHSIDLLSTLDEPSITTLALAATNQRARTEIVEKGILKMGGGQ